MGGLMRVVDVNRNPVTSYDEALGCLYETEIVVGQTPDGQDEWETVLVYEPYTEEQLAMMREQEELAAKREEEAAQAAAYAQYFTALTSAYGE